MIEPSDKSDKNFQDWKDGKALRACSCGVSYHAVNYGTHLLDGTHNKRLNKN